VDEGDWLAERFEANRAHLRGVAYRMLGSLSEADDAVQEAWLRLSRSDTSGVENLGGWLTTVVARVCLDMLRGRGSLRESRLARTCPSRSPAARTRSTPSSRRSWPRGSAWRCWWSWTGWLPAERLAFVLHDRFAVPFEEIAPILTLVNGAAGIVSRGPGGRPFSVMGFTVRHGKIVEIDILADPSRLRQLDLAVLDD